MYFYTHIFKLKYNSNDMSFFSRAHCCHGNHVDAAIAENDKCIHISGIRHDIIVNEASTPTFSRSNITLKICPTVSSAHCCYGNHVDDAIAKNHHKFVHTSVIRHDIITNMVCKSIFSGSNNMWMINFALYFDRVLPWESFYCFYQRKHH